MARRAEQHPRAPEQRGAPAVRVGIAAEPATWGPVLWDVLFCAAFRAKEHATGQEQIARIAALLPAILPCPSCRASCDAFCTHLPPRAIRDGDVAQWLWTMKDAVNQKLRKATRPYHEVKRRYATFPALHSDATLLTLCVVIALGGDDARASAVCQFFDALVALRPSLATHMQPGLADALAAKPTGAAALAVAVGAATRQRGQAPDLDELIAIIVVPDKQDRARRSRAGDGRHAP